MTHHLPRETWTGACSPCLEPAFLLPNPCPVSEPSSSGESPPSPAKRGRLGFSRTALSVAGVVVLLGFLMWFFVFV